MHGGYLIISSYPTDIFLRLTQDMVFQCIIMLVYLVPRVEQNLDSYLPFFIYPGQLWGIERSGFFNDRGKWVKGFENQRV